MSASAGTPHYDLADPGERDRLLRSLPAAGDAPIAIAEAALALAALDRPRVDLGRYLRHLDSLAADIAAETRAASTIADRVAALNAVILGKYRYAGDRLNYDDLQNANLMRVIDRRKGLPVALGILYIHGARAQGWPACGIAFPGHFMLQLGEGGQRAIIDPFHDGMVRGAPELRALLRSLGGDIELEAAHYAPVADRRILLRLQNNIKLRLVQARQAERALRVVESMLILAPEEAALWREAALLRADRGNYRAAIAALDEFLDREGSAARRHEAAVLMQQLKRRLN
jgi:regulator of sirC expression with transglutaminase-like and TPR domain